MSAKFWHQDVRVSTRTFVFEKVKTWTSTWHCLVFCSLIPKLLSSKDWNIPSLWGTFLKVGKKKCTQISLTFFQTFEINLILKVFLTLIMKKSMTFWKFMCISRIYRYIIRVFKFSICAAVWTGTDLTLFLRNNTTYGIWLHTRVSICYELKSTVLHQI